MDVTMIVTPEPGRQKEIGRLLLDLAANPYEVQWVTWPTAGFLVSLELFERFEAAGKAPVAEEAEAAPVAKKRGRPRKTPQATAGDNTSEEE